MGRDSSFLCFTTLVYCGCRYSAWCHHGRGLGRGPGLTVGSGLHGHRTLLSCCCLLLDSLSVLPVTDPSGVFPGFAQICSLQLPRWLNPVGLAGVGAPCWLWCSRAGVGFNARGGLLSLSFCRMVGESPRNREGFGFSPGEEDQNKLKNFLKVPLSCCWHSGFSFTCLLPLDWWMIWSCRAVLSQQKFQVGQKSESVPGGSCFQWCWAGYRSPIVLLRLLCQLLEQLSSAVCAIRC